MIKTETMFTAEHDDSELVSGSLTGQRDAFKHIVERYQSLICSLAYSATGSLSQSEDIAQETFVTAWKQLSHLREPAKLRSWLCGITRNLIGKALRGQGRQPTHAAESLDTAQESPTPEPFPSDQAISREEEAILWRALERIPEIYREPLVLFYREHKSIENVAADLDLNEDAVKQRLSRGRKLLHEQVLAFVEGALARTNPGQSFTLGALAALPMLPTSAQAATIAASVAKTGALAKSAGLVGLFNALLGFVGMFLGTYCGYRLDRESARSPQECKLIARYYRLLVTWMTIIGLAALALTLFGWPLLEFHVSLMTRLGLPQLKFHPALYAGLLVGLGIIYLGVGAALTIWLRLSLRKINQDKTGHPAPLRAPIFEYRSRVSLFGWPLVHVRLRGGLERGPVKAWLAGGDAAIGLVFAFGAVAIAPISFGGFALGVLTLGGVGIGVVPLGGFSFGLYALGGLAVGLQAFGGCAIGWTAAEGGVAVARDFAIGAAASARHANDALAEAFIQDSAFFQCALAAMRYVPWLNLLCLLPLVLWLRKRRTMRSLMMLISACL
jgi:RNA polymerase sigma factor (sigma-70 family)